MAVERRVISNPTVPTHLLKELEDHNKTVEVMVVEEVVEVEAVTVVIIVVVDEVIISIVLSEINMIVASRKHTRLLLKQLQMTVPAMTKAMLLM